MLCRLAVLALIATFVAGWTIDSEFQHRQAFAHFKARFNKAYATPEEEQARYTIFKQNSAKFEALNEGEKFSPFGVNEFTDLTADEFRSRFLMAKNRAHLHNKAEARVADLSKYAGSPIPQSFDWKSKNAVTPVKNQGQCGSCWAFSATENIESIWFLQGNHTLVSLAPQQIVDCDKVDAGCNGGDTPTAYEYVIKAGGLETEADYPYTARDGACKAVQSKEVATVDGYEYATKTQNETEMLVYTYNIAPLSICVDAETWQHYNSGVVTKNCAHALDHCVMITGFGTDADVDYWSVRNSWGTSWGEAGYIRIERNKNLCGIAVEATSTYIH